MPRHAKPAKRPVIPAVLLRLIRRPRGVRNAPRGGEVFPTGPQPVKRPARRSAPPTAPFAAILRVPPYV